MTEATFASERNPRGWIFLSLQFVTKYIENMKKLLFFSLLFCMFSCAYNMETEDVGAEAGSIESSSGSSEASYNVNIYDARGDWYETGLLIESFDNRTFVKINDGRYELLTSDKEEYRYMIEIDGEMLYVK